MRTRKRERYRKMIEGDLEILPLMNLFVAIIPMLLLSAVFLNLTVIDMKAPSDASAATDKPALALAITIKNDYFVVEGRGIAKRVVVRSAEDAEAQLSAALAEVVAEHPDNEDVMIISQPHTNYGDIIAVMDVAREAGLPSVSLLGAD